MYAMPTILPEVHGLFATAGFWVVLRALVVVFDHKVVIYR